MTELRFRLNLTYEQALRYYEGRASTVIVRAENGQTVSFPAQHIRPFVDANGVHGVFRIQFDQNRKLQGLTRVAN